MSDEPTTTIAIAVTTTKTEPPPKSRATLIAAAHKTLNNNKFQQHNGDEQLLGSTFLPNDATENGHSLRTSARVIHKIRMDSMRQPSPPPATMEKKETDSRAKADHKNPRTPSQQKTLSRVVWSNAEKNMFFEALNVYGRDFDAIATYINNKQKRRNLTDNFFKTKDQVRVLYYQFFQKATKYLKFSEGKLVLIRSEFDL